MVPAAPLRSSDFHHRKGAQRLSGFCKSAPFRHFAGGHRRRSTAGTCRASPACAPAIWACAGPDPADRRPPAGAQGPRRSAPGRPYGSQEPAREQFVVVGKASGAEQEEYLRSLRSQAVELGIEKNVRFVGFVDESELAAAHAEAFALVHPVQRRIRPDNSRGPCLCASRDRRGCRRTRARSSARAVAACSLPVAIPPPWPKPSCNSHLTPPSWRGSHARRPGQQSLSAERDDRPDPGGVSRSSEPQLMAGPPTGRPARGDPKRFIMTVAVTAPRATLSTLQIGMQSFPERGGGLDRVYYDLARMLPGAGVEFRGLVAGSAQVAADENRAVRAFAPSDAGLMKRWSAVREAVRRELAAGEFDLAVSHFALYTFPVRQIIADQGVPLVVHFHGPWAAESRQEGAGRAGRVDEGCDRAAGVSARQKIHRDFPAVRMDSCRQLWHLRITDTAHAPGSGDRSLPHRRQPGRARKTRLAGGSADRADGPPAGASHGPGGFDRRRR